MEGSKSKLNGSSHSVASRLSYASGLYRGSGMGVLHSHGVWSAGEKRVWLVALCIGGVLLYASRMVLPVVVVDLGDRDEWSNKTTGAALSSFYWGYMLTQIVGGKLADRYGGDTVIWSTSLLWALGCLALSYLTYSSRAVIALGRFVIGLAQGVFMPALVSLVTHRVHEGERNLVLGAVWSGTHVGTAMAGGVGSLLLRTTSWPPVFIIFGVSGLVWAAALRSVSHRSKHQTHYKLSEPTRTRERLKLDVPSASVRGVPWRKILSEPAVLVLFCAFSAKCIFLHTMVSWTPTYFHASFPHMHTHAWLYNSLPWLMLAVGTLLGMLSANWTAKLGADMTVVRRTLTAIGLGGSGLFLILLSAVGQEYRTSLLLLSLSCLLGGVAVGGLSVNIADLTPMHVVALYAVMNTVGAFLGALGVILTGYLLDTTSSWTLALCFLAGTNTVGMVAFLLYGSADRLELVDS